MNVENILKTIAIMERAKDRKTLDMRYWQHNPGLLGVTEAEHPKASSEAQLHTCGNKACLAGHIAISPEWRDAGGFMGSDGSPLLYRNHLASFSLAEWWDIGLKHANFFIMDREGVSMYGREWKDVEPDDVIKQLRALIDLGEDEYFRYIDMYWGKGIPVPDRIYEISHLVKVN